MMLWFLATLSLHLPVDSLTGMDVSGNGQRTTVGHPFRSPFRVMVMDSIPVAGVPVTVAITTPERDWVQSLSSDARGWVEVALPPLEKPGEVKIVFSLLEVPDTDVVTLRGWVLDRGYLLRLLVLFIGGFTLFFFGFRRGSRGLVELAGVRVRNVLWRLARRPWTGFLGGFLATLAFQSSTAFSVLLVSFVDAGWVPLRSALAAVLGGGVATTLTVQFLALGVFDLALLVVAVGYVVERRLPVYRSLGRALFGFGLVFYSIALMSSAAGYLEPYPEVARALSSMQADYTWAGFLLGAVLAALVHSSAAVIGILLSLAFQHLVSLEAAFPIILGANVGTTFTALVAASGGGVDGRRVALAHLLFKLTGVLLIWKWTSPLSDWIHSFSGSEAQAIANAHTLFNLGVAALAMPFLRFAEALVIRLVSVQESALPTDALSAELFEHPEVALTHIQRKVLQVADTAFFMVRESLQAFRTRDVALIERILREDDKIDALQRTLTPFLSRLLEEHEMPASLTRRMVATLHVLGEIEHIGDIVSRDLMPMAHKMRREGLTFSREGWKDLESLHREVLQTFELALGAFTSWDPSLAKRAWERRDEINQYARELYGRHLDRLAQGLQETLSTSTIHLDVISGLERINFHCASIGAAVLGHIGS